MRIALAPMALSEYRTPPELPSYRNDVATMMRKIRAIGYEGVESGIPSGYSAETFREVLDEAGLVSVTCAWPNYPELEGSDFRTLLQNAKILGSANAMVSNMPPPVLGNPEALKAFIANLNRVGKLLMEEGGVHLSYHNHAIDFSPVGGARAFDRIIEGTDERYVFIEPDTHWIQAGGGHVVTWLRRLRGRVYVAHFKDYAIDPDSDHTYLESAHKLFAEVGEGNLNWRGIVGECLEGGIPWCAVEQDRVRRPGYEACAISYANLAATMREMSEGGEGHGA